MAPTPEALRSFQSASASDASIAHGFRNGSRFRFHCKVGRKQSQRNNPGVGPLTALAYVLIIGSPERFRCGKQIGSYLGLIPSEESSARRQRLGHISKQGNALLRFLLIEAAQAATRSNPAWRREFLHLTMRRGRQIATVALARKLAVRLYWMWRNGWDYEKSLQFGSHVGQPGTGYGVK
jgi:transposase